MNYKHLLGFQIAMAMRIQTVVFHVMTACSVAGCYQFWKNITIFI